MTDKYIDLANKIVESTGCVNTANLNMGIGHALRWLDDHPDQTPGRTITESQYSTLTAWAKGYSIYGWKGREMLSDIGITIVDDPEPSNAEKLTDELEAWGLTRSEALDLGPWLAGQGWTKVPGGDDEH